MPLGVLPKYKTQLSEMIEIMSHLQQYVAMLGVSACNTERSPHKIIFGGNQLTEARARSGQEARLNSDTCSGHLEGLQSVAENWHTGVVFLTVSIT